MTRGGRAVSALAALALVLAAALPAGGSGAAPRSGGLSISIILPVNGSAVRGDVGIAGNASGPEGVPLSVQLSIDGGPWYAAEGNLSWTWLWSTFAFQDGLHNVTARVQGGGSEETAAASYLVRNKKPVFILENIFPPGDELHLKVGDRAGFSVRVNTTGAEGFLVNWSLDGQVLQSGGSDLYNYTPRADEVGGHAVRVAVIADGAEEASHSWNLTVRALALPPVVAGFGPEDRNFTVYFGDTVRFNVSAGDPQGRGLTYRWSYDLSPAPGNVTDSWLELLFNSTGEHVVEVVISNGETNRTVRWNVTVSEAPTIGIFDVMPCMAYIIIGLILGIWYGRRTREEERRKAQGAGHKA